MGFSRQVYWNGLSLPSPKCCLGVVQYGNPASTRRSPSIAHADNVGICCCCSITQSCPTLRDPMDCTRQASQSFTISWSLLKLLSIELAMPFSYLILCRSLLLLLSIFPSITVFSSESTLRMRWPKYWSFSFSVIPSKEIPGLISFRMDWLNLLAVQGTLKSLLQHHSTKALILRHSAFFLHNPTLTSIHDHWKNHSLD